jgi:hypothetical protein
MRTAPRLLVRADPLAPANIRTCLWCLAPLVPSKTKPRVFCSDQCRKRAARVTPERVDLAHLVYLQMANALTWKEGKRSRSRPVSREGAAP